jgi:hypothetical protein
MENRKEMTLEMETSELIELRQTERIGLRYGWDLNIVSAHIDESGKWLAAMKEPELAAGTAPDVMPGDDGDEAVDET